MHISLIAAVAQNGVIGNGSSLPWRRLKADMQNFVQRTTGHHIIMGRKTFESMRSKPLPNRVNIVISRDPSYKPSCMGAPDLERALELAQAAGETEAFIIGGAQIYELALPYADLFYRTRVLADLKGDVSFPSFNEAEWDTRVEGGHDADENNEYAFIVETLTRRRLQ